MDIQAVMEMAKINLQDDGSLMPALFLEAIENGKIATTVVGIADLPKTSRARQIYMAQIGIAIAMRTEPVSAIAVNDTYVREFPTTSIEEALEIRQSLPDSLADDPEAKEAIVVTSLDRNGKEVGIMQPYEREASLDLEKTKIIWLEPKFDTQQNRMHSWLLEAFWKGVSFVKEKPEMAKILAKSIKMEEI